MVSQARQAGNHVLERAVRPNARDRVGIGDVEGSFMPDRAGHRACLNPTVLGPLKKIRVFARPHVYLENARTGLDFVSALDDVTGSLVIETAVDRGREACRDHIGDVAVWQKDVACVEPPI